VDGTLRMRGIRKPDHRGWRDRLQALLSRGRRAQ
jgi:hypothetical protein